MTLPVVVVGLSHKTAPVEVRERFAAGDAILPEVLSKLAAREELDEVMFLSTCNRVEVVALAKRGPSLDAAIAGASHAIRDALREHIGASHVGELADYLYEHDGDEAVRHVFRVASSLDSMVLGEPQILGQVKDAYDAAVEAGVMRSHLARCLNRAFAVAKRVRSETAVGEGSVSIASVSVDLAKRIFGDLTGSVVLLVGAGEMAEQAAKSLGKSANAIRVCNRSFDRAAQLAATFGGTAAPLERLEEELVASDVVVTSTSSRTYVVTRDLVKRAMKKRKGKTLFFVDIAVPRNVEPAVHGLDNVYVFNVDDLEAEVAENLRARKGEVTAAETIVENELAEFRAWARSLDVQPAIVALRARTKSVLAAELERTLGGRLKHLGEAERAALAQMVESATSKLLHAPTTRLKSKAALPEGSDLVRALQELFELPEETISAITPRGTPIAAPVAPISSPELPAAAGEDDHESKRALPR